MAIMWVDVSSRLQHCKALTGEKGNFETLTVEVSSVGNKVT
jgi:hypothetical protein